MEMTYDETMQYGTGQYSDILEALLSRGLPARFIQTGGMNAAIMMTLEAGFYLLATDRDESLAWERIDHVGWYVGLYKNIEDAGTEPLRWQESDDSDFAALTRCIDEVMRLRR